MSTSGRTPSLGRLIAMILGSCGAVPAIAQIVTDGTMGPGSTLTGPDFIIGEALGTRFGANLFHSFSDFNVLQGESATFTSNFAGATDNVISRVTGGNPSQINGLLRSTIAGADFWFINPNGLVFGQNAVLDVPAGFHASTADVIELEGGGSFRATNPNASSLTIAPPSAFGFLDATVGSISVNGADLSVANGQSLSLVGGTMVFQGATLEALAGRIDLVSVASAGDVAVDAAAGAAPVLTGFSALANITMFGATSMDAGASGAQSGGTASLVGSTISVFEGSTVDVGTSNAADAGDIVVNASNGLVVADGGSLLAESTSGAANAGDAGRQTLTAGTINMHSGGQMSVDTTNGAGGRIVMNTGALELRDTVSTQVSADTHGNGRGGDIVIRGLASTDNDVTAADSVVVALGASIHSNSTGSGAQAGQAGTVTIDSNTTRLVQGGFLSVTTVDGTGTDGQGNAVGGDIDIHTNLFVTEENGFLRAGSTGAGQGGDISIQAFNPDAPFSIISQTDGAIVTSTSGSGDAGSITLGSAEAPVDFFRLGSPNLPFDDTRGLFSESTAVGPDAGAAGSITVFADQVDIQGAQLSVATVDGSRVDDAGNPVGGSINLNIGTLQLGTFGVISAATSGAGAGGSITILANDPDTSDARPAIEIFDGVITTSSSGAGDAGSITVGSADAPVDFIWMHDFEFDAPGHVPNDVPHGLFSDSTATGAGGEITVYANRIEIQDGGSISASTVDGDGGAIDVHADELQLNLSTITAATSGGGDAGDITLSGVDGAMGLFEAVGTGSGLFSDASSTGNAGSITVTADEVVLENEAEISVDTQDGAGGSTTLQVGSLTLLSDSQITASTQGSGNAGNVVITGTDGVAPASAVTLAMGGTIFTRSTASGPDAGAAGNVEIHADSLSLALGSGIIANNVDGAGGSISIHADRIDLFESQVSVIGLGSGDAGNIAVTGTDGAASLLSMDGIETTGLFSASTGTGPVAGAAGSISINSLEIELGGEASIAASTVDGAGGAIDLEVDHLNLGGSSNVTAGTHGQGDGGQITVRGSSAAAAQLIEINRAGSITTSSDLSGAGAGDAGSISIAAAELQLTSDQEGAPAIDASTIDGAGGSITLAVDSLTVEGGSIQASTTGRGNAGSITITGADGGEADLVVLNFLPSRITSASLSTASDAGDAGSIDISAREITLLQGSTITSETAGGGNGGSVHIGVDALTVSGQQSMVNVGTTGSGDAGNIVIEGIDGAAASSIVLDGETAAIRSGATRIFGSPAQIGAAGSITILAQSITLDNLATISVLTDGSAGGTIDLGVDSLTVGGGASIDARTTAAGDAGDISIHGIDGGRAGSVVVSGTFDGSVGTGIASRITSDSSGTGPDAGAAGNVRIAADSVTVSDGALVRADTVDGVGGTIRMEVGDLTVMDGAAVRTNVTGSGTGGSIEVVADDTVFLNGGQLLAESVGSGASGSVSIAATQLVLEDGATLSVRSTGAGRAGSVFADLDRLLMSGFSQIDATATSSLAGNVEMNVSEVAILQDSIISGLSADPENDGGNFIIQHPEALILQRSSILANSASGAGGNISISADAIVLDTSSTVEATGEVLTTGEILGNVVQLEPPVVVDAAAALDTRCSSQQATERSSMVVHPSPAGAVRDPYLPANAAVATANCGN